MAPPPDLGPITDAVTTLSAFLRSRYTAGAAAGTADEQLMAASLALAAVAQYVQDKEDAAVQLQVGAESGW